ncbi:MAG: PQQ-dependent sugar dehydrogenase [Actinomycetota bacterium]|nr:PQQ-dependent sugar dehydrogenase [Actinomycetota bacterium]
MRRLPLVLVAVALLSSCGGDDDDGSSDRSTTTAPSDTSTAAPTTTAAEPPTTTTTPPTDLNAVSVRLEEVASGLESPVAIAFRTGDDRAWVAEQGGRVRIVADGAPLDPPVIEVDVSGGNEQGLLGLAFSPDGSKLYVDYTDPDGHTHVDEYTMNGDAAENRRELLFVEQPYANHNGGQLAVDGNGLLYISLGDGGSGGDPEDRAQNRGELLGKILRIDPNGDPYAIPSDNPFVADASTRPEIWMWGLRNPWRFTFDRATGDTWIADVGQNAWEEIDYAPAAEASGINWGWDEREGLHSFEGEPPEGARDPITERPLGEYCSLIGGYVYRGAAVANMYGVYLFSDHCRGGVEALVQEGGAVVAERDLDIDLSSPTSFGEDHDGELYVLSREGTLFKFVNG